MTYRTTDWKTRPNYECDSCGFSTLDEAVMQYHQDAAHSHVDAPEAVTEQWPAVLTSPGIEPVIEVPQLEPAVVDSAATTPAKGSSKSSAPAVVAGDAGSETVTPTITTPSQEA